MKIRGVRLAVLAIAAGGCGASSKDKPAAAPATETRTAEPARAGDDCGPLTVMVDGGDYPGLVANVAVLEITTSEAHGTHELYQFNLRPQPSSCDFEGTSAQFDDAQPEIWVAVGKTRSTIGVRNLYQDQVEGRVIRAPEKIGDPVIICVDRAEPLTAQDGLLDGKSVLVRGRLEGKYCGTRAEIQQRLGPG